MEIATSDGMAHVALTGPAAQQPAIGVRGAGQAWDGRAAFLFVLTPSLLMDGPSYLIVWNFVRILFALFLGTGETFQIWNPQLLLAEPRIPDDLKDIARFRLDERGGSQ